MIEGLRIERTTPSFLANERFRRILFGAHPYAIISPTEAQVKAYRLQQLPEFYRTHYRPANALLIAVGDFSAPRNDGADRADFRLLETGGSSSRSEPRLCPNCAAGSVHLVHLPGAVQAQILVGNHAITRKHPDWLRLALANSMYGGAFNSRLVMNIREAKGYTYSPRSGVHALRQHGYFSVHAAVRNDVVAATLTEIFYELDRMRSLPVGEDELADARNYLSGVFSLGLATQDGLAGQLSSVYLNGCPKIIWKRIAQRIRALTAADVLAAARVLRFAQRADRGRGRPRADCRCRPNYSGRSPSTMLSLSEPAASPIANCGRKSPEDEFIGSRARIWFYSFAGSLLAALLLGRGALAQKNPPAAPVDLNTATVGQLEAVAGRRSRDGQGHRAIPQEERPFRARGRSAGDSRHHKPQARTDAPYLRSRSRRSETCAAPPVRQTTQTKTILATSRFPRLRSE